MTSSQTPTQITDQGNKIAKLIAFYLPQFHPIPENDAWWGKGFTEWTNVVKAKPQFWGHYQPHLPSDLGFYDLRLPEVREEQAALAAQYGIHGFCYYHYWFHGRRILERPFSEVLKAGQPNFPFCLCWPNENWTRAWDGQDREMLLEQTHSQEDDLNHINSLLPAFEDDRYIRLNEKPIFLIYRAKRLPDSRATTDRWRRHAEKRGFKGLHLLRVQSRHDELDDPIALGFDGAVEFQPRFSIVADNRIWRQKWWHRRRLRTDERGFTDHLICDYAELAKRSIQLKWPSFPWHRCVCPSFDNTARRAKGGTILSGASPQLYERWLTEIVSQAYHKQKNGAEPPVVFINAWNEWAEGNHLEPCVRWGRQYLEATRRALGGFQIESEHSQAVHAAS